MEVDFMEFLLKDHLQKFRQINVLLKNFTVNWFDEKKFCFIVNFSFFHIVMW